MFFRRKQVPAEPQVTHTVLEHSIAQFPINESYADHLSVDDLLRGLMIFGGTGSGKTTGSGAFLASSLLALGCGGLVLCVKGEECSNWENYAYAMGREDDLIIFGFNRGYAFNFLEHELNRQGQGAGLTENLFAIFSELRELLASGLGMESDRFWQESAERVFKNAVDILVVSQGTLSLLDIQRLVETAPRNVAETQAESWQEESFLGQCLASGMAQLEDLDDVRAHDFKLASRYWLDEFPRMAERTRSSIVSTFNNMLSNLTRGAVRPLISNPTNVIPEDAFEGKIIVLDLPVHEYGLAGRMVQVIFKYLWQKAVLRRSITQDTLPVFLWADECQEMVTRNDRSFLNVERSYRATTIYLTQNLANIKDVVGERNAEALLASFQNFIFHANSDHLTNQWAAQKIGQRWQKQVSTSANQSLGGSGGSYSSTSSEVYKYQVEPSDFLALRNGGALNHYLVDGILLRASRPWLQTAAFHRLVSFEQLYLV